MSIQAVAWALELEMDDAGRKLLLVALANHADPEGRCWPSIGLLEREASQSRRTVQRKLDELVEAGLLEIREDFDRTGRQKQNRYFLKWAGVRKGSASEGVDGGEGANLTPSGEGVSLTPRGVTGGTPRGVTADTPKQPSEEPSPSPPPPLAGGVGVVDQSDSPREIMLRERRHRFERFWSAYLGAGGVTSTSSQPDAEKAFAKLSPPEQEAAIRTAGKYLRSELGRGRRVRSPATYLSGKLWLGFDVPEGEAAPALVWVRKGSPEWDAWEAYQRRVGKVGPVGMFASYSTTHRSTGRDFPSAWPPGHESRSAPPAGELAL